MFTEKNCVRSMYKAVEGDSNVGCVGIIKAAWLKAEAHIPENQLFRIGGGFGASPSKMGNAVFGEFCVDGEHCRVERHDFIGIADEETTKYAEQLEAKWKK